MLWHVNNNRKDPSISAGKEFDVGTGVGVNREVINWAFIINFR